MRRAACGVALAALAVSGWVRPRAPPPESGESRRNREFRDAVEGRRLQRQLGDHDSVLRVRDHVRTDLPHAEGYRGITAPHVPRVAVLGFQARKSEYPRVAEDRRFGT